MTRLLIFAVASVYFVTLSRRSLFRPHTHGFYRFFAFEAIAALVLLNYPRWFNHPFAIRQIFSWTLLLISIWLVLHGTYLLRVVGKPSRERSDDTLLPFEKTSSLVTTGIYGYIRHPMYASLLFLAWGAFLKHLSWPGLALVLLASLSLYAGARREETECLQHFGDAYREYMTKTKGFIPFLF
jgi:protein-S-isoprenylcysteine O-methyltransferase Ste14